MTTASRRPTSGSVLFVLALYAITAGLVAWSILDPTRAPSEWTPLRVAALLLFVPSLVKYYLQVLVAPLYGLVLRSRHRGLPDAGAAFAPRVTALVPAWNEEVGVLPTVRSLVASTYRDLEVIVIDDGSTDQTGDVVRGYIAEIERRGVGVSVRYLRQDNAGKAVALNRGLAYATGDIIVTIDADSVVDPEAIGNLVQHYRDPRVMSVAGNVKIGNPSRVLGLVQQLEYLFGFYFKRADTVLDTIYIVGGAAASYRRTVLDRIGGFDPSIITEDIELSTRIQAAGGVIAYAPDAVVYTEGPTTVSGLCKQRLRWKYGRLLTFWRYRGLFFSLRARHSWLLTGLILPIALFSEVLLLLEVPLLVIFYGYMLTTGDYLPLLLNIGITTAVIVVQVLSDPKGRRSLHLLLLAPVAWLVFYLIDAVELQSLVRSIGRLVRRQGVTWQKWTRTGVFDGPVQPDAAAAGPVALPALARTSPPASARIPEPTPARVPPPLPTGRVRASGGATASRVLEQLPFQLPRDEDERVLVAS